MRSSSQISPNYGVVKAKLLESFKQMRKRHKFICRSNFWCCSSCAGYDITIKAEEMLDKKKVVNGCVFWHKQDEERFKSHGSLYLAFGQMNSTKYGVIGFSDEEVGKLVCECLSKNGLEYEWDGSGGQRILVKGLAR
jgi:hypothetical protein